MAIGFAKILWPEGGTGKIMRSLRASIAASVMAMTLIAAQCAGQAPVTSDRLSTPANSAPLTNSAPQQDLAYDIPHCEKSLGTISVADGDDPSAWTQWSLQPPSQLLKVMIQQSGCFRIVDRGSGLNAASHERETGGDLHLQRGSHLGKGQIKAADYVLVAETKAPTSNPAGTLIGGLISGGTGSLLGGVRRPKTEANAIMSLTVVRTTETIVTEEGYASKATAPFAANGASRAAKIAGGGYDNSDVGRLHTLAYANAFKKLVEAARAATSSSQAPDAPFLPWPPPIPSGLSDVSRAFKRSANLGGIEAQIRTRLALRGYEKLRHFSVPNGFAITTDVERIKPDGTPAADRWRTGKAPSSGGLMQYITDLFAGEEGRFRLFAFLVTDQDPVPANYRAEQMDIDRWKSSGRLALSRQMSAAAVQPGTKIWLLVYEFELSKSKVGKLVAPEQDGLPYSKHIAFLGFR